MQNITFDLNQPYVRDADAAQVRPWKIAFSAEFSDVDTALRFQRDLNELVIKFRTNDVAVR